MQTEYKIEYELDEKLWTRAYWISGGKKFPIIMLLFIFIVYIPVFIVFIPNVFFLSVDGLQAFVPRSILFVASSLLILFSNFWMKKRACFQHFKKIATSRMLFRFSEDTFYCECGPSKSDFQWNMFHKLRRTRDIWLLYLSSNTYVVLPTKILTEDIKQLVERKLVENNIKIVGK